MHKPCEATSLPESQSVVSNEKVSRAGVNTELCKQPAETCWLKPAASLMLEAQWGWVRVWQWPDLTFLIDLLLVFRGKRSDLLLQFFCFHLCLLLGILVVWFHG